MTGEQTNGVTGARVIAVAADGAHRFAKPCRDEIMLLAGLGDAHLSATVQHLSRMKKAPDLPNLRQVHLIHGELFDELAGKGFVVLPGELGENVIVRGIDLLGLGGDTVLALGHEARVRVTGLRNPCVQIDRFQRGMTAATLETAADGSLEQMRCDGGGAGRRHGACGRCGSRG